MKNSAFSQSRGFSLIELMVVLGIVGLLLAFAAPNLFSLISSSTLTGEGQVLRNQLTYAQQIAISKSADVEVRFFKVRDSSGIDATEAFRAFQLYQYDIDGELAPVSTLFRVRAPVAINEQLSTLLSPGEGSADDKDKRFGISAPTSGSANVSLGEGGAEISADFVAFRFRPDGSTDLPHRTSSNDTWYLTLVQGEGAANSEEPRNYLCLQVNPYNGQISEFRP